VIIPSYNSGTLLVETVRAVLGVWKPVVVVLDGCTDGSAQKLNEAFAGCAGLRVVERARNGGKGAAVLEGLRVAKEQGWTHAAVLDSDGQHCVADVPRFMAASKAHPEAMVLGEPVFGEDAPWERVWGRRLGNFWTNVETLWGGVRDSLFGFRVYPVEPSLQILTSIRGGRRFDFDTQLVVRLCWAGVPPLNLRTRVVYRPEACGGVSHFRYWRDNALLIGVHAQLVLGSLSRWPRLLKMRRQAPLILDV
jgi:glycosyltransferase involved in cell wall biosynthesis